MRLFLAIWLGVFSVQGADLLTVLTPDDCLELATDSRPGDPCPDTCARCVCCARIVTSLSPDVVSAPGDLPAIAAAPAELDVPISAEPHGILHVPKTR